MVGLNGKAQQNPENGLFIINGECANIQDICKTRRARNGSLFYSSTVYFKKSTVHYIGKNKRDVISDNIYIVCPLVGCKTSGGCLLCAYRNEMETTHENSHL